jgi:hypothetical protein
VDRRAQKRHRDKQRQQSRQKPIVPGRPDFHPSSQQQENHDDDQNDTQATKAT